MANDKKVLGLVTARGGSKRVPRKNIKEFLGKPLLAWTAEVGLESGVFDRFVLTTDDQEIADVGKHYGLEVPFLRPAEFARDTSTSLDAIKHAVEWLRDNEGYENEHIVLLEPTAPGRQVSHVREVAELIRRGDVDSIYGVTELPAHYHPLKVMKMNEDGTIVRATTGKLIRESHVRNQDYDKVYFTNSAIYAFTTANFYHPSHPSLSGDRTLGYIMDEKYAFDIDTPEDWIMAEMKMKLLLDRRV